MSVAYEQSKNPIDYRFSQSEIKLLNLLPQDGTKINTLELTKKFYSGPPGHDLLLSSLLPQDEAMGSPSSGPGAPEG
jgi:hypothetical protein